MEAVGGWVQNLVVIMILAAIVEFILPRSSMERYVRFIIGLVIILVILTPLTRLLSVDFIFNENILAADKAFEEKLLAARLDNKDIYNEKTIIETFRKKLIMEIDKDLKSIDGVRETIIRIEMEEELSKDNFGQIYSIDLTVLHRDNSIENIKTVRIEIGNNNLQEFEEVNSDLKRDITSILTGKYKVDRDRITIKGGK